MAVAEKGKSLSRIKEKISVIKEYWTEPPKGNYIPYKEIASLSGAGFGIHWITLLASTIGLDASNFLVGASIGLRPCGYPHRSFPQLVLR